jgi:hypothetical protein
MVEALQEEINKLETEEVAENEETTEAVTEETSNNEVEDVEKVEEETSEIVEDVSETPTEDEIAAKQSAYKARQEQKKREAEERRQLELKAKADSAVNLTNIPDEKDIILREAAKLVQEKRYNDAILAGEKELKTLERDFVDAFPDYNDVVERALDATKMRMVSQGMDESDVDAYLRKEKVLIADRAAAQGLDPVEAVYNEAKGIVSWLDGYAEKMGYVKNGEKAKLKTNLQAIREISKPAAVGTGRGTGAAKKTFDEMDDLEEIGQVTLGDLMSGNI